MMVVLMYGLGLLGLASSVVVAVERGGEAWVPVLPLALCLAMRLAGPASDIWHNHQAKAGREPRRLPWRLRWDGWQPRHANEEDASNGLAENSYYYDRWKRDTIPIHRINTPMHQDRAQIAGLKARGESGWRYRE